MTSPRTSRGKKGFTLIEVMVVIGIFLLLAALSLGIGVDTVGRATVGSERMTMVQLLERARSRAMNNIGNVPHGVIVTSTDFVLFEGVSYSSTALSNEVSPRSAGVTVTGTTPVIFTQLSGTTTPGTIDFSNGAQTYTIGINGEGRIDW